jgi:hypothetical protein
VQQAVYAPTEHASSSRNRGSDDFNDVSEFNTDSTSGNLKSASYGVNYFSVASDACNHTTINRVYGAFFCLSWKKVSLSFYLLQM